jgi:hypothetical protein
MWLAHTGIPVATARGGEAPGGFRSSHGQAFSPSPIETGFAQS